MVWYDMDTDPERPVQMNNLSNLRGQIERITFCNEENDFRIGKMKVPGEKDLVIVVGALPGINPGEILDLLGESSIHPKFGNQFKVVKFKSVMPATAVGIEKYLGSDLTKGIGPVMATRLVKKFGVATPRLGATKDFLDV
jgi:exodeoxyribonuclease V alpha subunit